MNKKWLLISLSIVVGIVLSCAILPLGGFAVLMGAAASTDTTTGPLPPSSWQEQIIRGSGSEHIVVIEVSGIIGAPDDTSLLAATLSHSQLLSQIRQAANDPKIKAVVLRIESPGGGVVASSEIHAMLKKVVEAEKPLVVSMGNMAASGGYYIATPADKIYANPDTLTGSLGVIISALNYDEAFDKLGLEQVVYKSGKYKDILSPARDATEQEDEILQAFVNEAYQGFVDVIVEGRELPREQVLNLADGRIYSGRQALNLNLVDELGNLDQAIEGAKDMAGLETALIVRYRAAPSLRDLFAGYVVQLQRPADPLGVREILRQQGPRLEYRLVP